MERKPIFRRVLDAVIEARTRQARRYIEEHARMQGRLRQD